VAAAAAQNWHENPLGPRNKSLPIPFPANSAGRNNGGELAPLGWRSSVWQNRKVGPFLSPPIESSPSRQPAGVDA